MPSTGRVGCFMVPVVAVFAGVTVLHASECYGVCECCFVVRTTVLVGATNGCSVLWFLIVRCCVCGISASLSVAVFVFCGIRRYLNVCTFVAVTMDDAAHVKLVSDGWNIFC